MSTPAAGNRTTIATKPENSGGTQQDKDTPPLARHEQVADGDNPEDVEDASVDAGIAEEPGDRADNPRQLRDAPRCQTSRHIGGHGQTGVEVAHLPDGKECDPLAASNSAIRWVWSTWGAACTWTEADDSYCAVVDGCFWMGLDGRYSGQCWWCDESHNYCGSLWRVLNFGGGPGDAEKNFGCWSVRLLCEQDEPTD